MEYPAIINHAPRAVAGTRDEPVLPCASSVRSLLSSVETVMSKRVQVAEGFDRKSRKRKVVSKHYARLLVIEICLQRN